MPEAAAPAAPPVQLTPLSLPEMPPLLGARGSEPMPAGVPRWMRALLIGSGALLVFLSIIVSGYGPRGDDLPHRIGTIIGAVAVWPAIILALFSISRRHRTPQKRAVILLVVWGVCIMGQLANINVRGQRSRTGQPPVPVPARLDEPQPVADRPARAAPETVPAADDEPRALAFDFSPGSHLRLIKSIESAQEDRYRSIAAEYARACRLRPDDALLALERVRFNENFAFAEEARLEAAEAEREAAVNHLTTRFPTAPVTVLYTMENAFGAEFANLVARHVAGMQQWPREHQARFNLLRAQREESEARKRELAWTSFRAQPTTDAGLLLIGTGWSPEQHRELVPVATHPVFDDAQPWMRKQVMDFLFDAGEHARALALFEEIEARAPALVRNAQTASRLAAAGRVEQGRELLAGIPPQNWNRESLRREQFQFELKHGDAAQSVAAYRKLRDIGLGADPLLRDRATLFVRHPGAGWSLADFAGVGLLGLAFAGLLVAPAALLLPVHYWSLLRARRATPSAWPDARWGLREAWIGVGLLLCAELIGIWVFQPEQMREWWSPRTFGAAPVAMTDAAVMGQQALAWSALLMVLVAAFWRARAWDLLGRGEWSWGRTIGFCLGGLLLLRIIQLGYTAIWPGALTGEPATMSPVTRQLCVALLKHAGPAGLIAAIAVLVPILEELFFRGVLLQALARHIPFGAANALQAVLFAAIHENLRMLPFFVAFGVLCGLLARRSRGLLPAIALHGGNNLLAAFALIATHR